MCFDAGHEAGDLHTLLVTQRVHAPQLAHLWNTQPDDSVEQSPMNKQPHVLIEQLGVICQYVKWEHDSKTNAQDIHHHTKDVSGRCLGP